MVSDPYRQESDHPVDQLRSMAKQALEGLALRLNRMPPSKLEKVAKVLGAIEQDHEGDPIRILEALRGLAIHPTPGMDLLVAGPFQVTSEESFMFLISHPHMFLPRALRIEVEHGRRDPHTAEFSLIINDTTVIDRCPVTEFARMTPIDIPVIAFDLAKVKLWGTGNHIEPVIRLIFRGENAPYTQYPGLPGGPGRPLFPFR